MKKIIIIISIIVLALGVVEFKICSSPKIIKFEKVSMQELAFKYNPKENSTEVSGSITSQVNYKHLNIDVIYLSNDNTQYTIQTIKIQDIKANQTKSFNQVLQNNNVSKDNYELHLNQIYHYITK